MIIIVFVSCLIQVCCSETIQRLLLHSDEDIVAALHELGVRMDVLERENTNIVAEVNSLRSQNNQLASEMQALRSMQSAGSIYIRWGRTSCPGNGTDLVYVGYSAGNEHNKHGAADFVCLPNEPLWGAFDDGAQPNTAKIAGTEYEFGDSYSNGGASFFGQNLNDHDTPCAVCRSGRPTTVMIPGRNQCYPGWTREYWGYLVSSADTLLSPSNYACLDLNAEWEAGDAENKDGKVMYMVEAQCGSLKCPPYVQNREITCVVCSK